jgi:hypothetical protein
LGRKLQMISTDRRYDPWYVKAAFGVFLCFLVGSLIALYSGVSNPMLIRLLDALS